MSLPRTARHSCDPGPAKDSSVRCPTGSFQQLMSYPFRRGMLGHRNVDGSAAIVRQNHEDKQHTKEHGRNHEKVGGDHILHVVGKERPPSLRRWFSTSRHVFGDSSLRELESQLQEFSVDARRILRIRSMTSRGAEGRPCGWRLLQLQYRRNPRRRQAMTVSGFTITRTDRQPLQSCESQRKRSATLSRSSRERLPR